MRSICLTSKEGEHNFLWLFLNEEEKNKASPMIKHVAERFVLCRSICKKILSEHLSIGVKNINFDYGKNGKPYLENEQNLLHIPKTSPFWVFVTALPLESI
jgi:phosphopantetheinyl transferase